MTSFYPTYPTSLYDFFVDLNFTNSVDKYNCIQTAILRYYLTAHTGKRLKNQRLNEEAIAKQIQKLKKIQVDSDFDVDSHIELIKKGGAMYGKTKNNMKSHVSYGKRFFDFVYQSVKPNKEKKKHNKDDFLLYNEAIMDKSQWVKKINKRGEKTVLQNDPSLFLKELEVKYPNLNKKEILQKAQNSLKSIFKIINSFIEYRKKTCRKTSYKKDVGAILRFLGWYKIDNCLSIDQLSIKKLFPIISPYVEYQEEELNDDNFITKIARKEWILKKEIKDKSKNFIAIVDKYLSDYKVNLKIRSKTHIIQSLIEFSRFLHKGITDFEENDNYQDISLINRLLVYKRDLDKIKEVEQDKTIPFTWEEIEAVCERLRKEANRDFEYDKRKTNNKGNNFTKRSKALRLQRFLAIAFFCVMPPDRQRTFRELTFGETLKYGIKDKNNTFRSYENLEPGEEAKYYIHLLPHQYKTGDSYGTYWYEINNIKYEDGKQFYDYLNQWLFQGYRDELATAGKTNALLIRTRTGVSFKMSDENFDEEKDSSKDSSTNFGQYIKRIFQSKTKYPLYPHSLRNIYITHINNQNLSQETRKAIAYMMHHDITTADNTYNKQTSDEKMALAVEYLNKCLSPSSQTLATSQLN